MFAGLCNLFMGIGLVKEGKNTNSTILLADGKHLLTDAISSGGIVLGLLIIYFTKMVWLDNVIALLAGCYICYTGFRLIKESVTHLLDEADYVKLNSLISILNMKRREKWIDIHNLRVLKYGTHIHVDAHITLPWYDNLELSHHEVSLVENLIKDELGDDVEFFIHADPCLPISCPICTVQNMLPDRKHQL